MGETIAGYALEEIIHAYGRMVSSICRRMIQDETVAEDAAQEVWLAVMKSLPTFKGQSKLSTWIYTITTRVVMNFARNERQHSTRFLRNYFYGETRPLPQESGFDKELWVKEMCDKCLTGMLHCLDNESRLAYIFREMAQLPYDEIAPILNKDEQTIRQTISRSRRKLRNFLKDECALFNPNGSCRCRMKRWVQEVELPQEYQKLRQTVYTVSILRESETILPGKDFWQKYL